MSTTGFQPTHTERQGDRALDEWLAEHLLGWPLERVRHQTFHADTHTLVPAFTLLDRLAFSHILPALQERGWSWSLQGFTTAGHVVCTLRRPGVIRTDGAPTVALAVARAAASAVRCGDIATELTSDRTSVEYPIADERVGAVVDRG